MMSLKNFLKSLFSWTKISRDIFSNDPPVYDKNIKDGIYYLSRFEMDKVKINELNNKLNKENKVLRHLITVIKKDDALIAADKMDEVPETNRNRR